MTVMIAFAIVIGLQMVGRGANGLDADSSGGCCPAVEPHAGADGHIISPIWRTEWNKRGATERNAARTGNGAAHRYYGVIYRLAVPSFLHLTGVCCGALWRIGRNNLRLRSQQVLVDLYKLAQVHEDPQYPSEVGMMRSYYGQDPTRLLKRLESPWLGAGPTNTCKMKANTGY